MSEISNSNDENIKDKNIKEGRYLRDDIQEFSGQNMETSQETTPVNHSGLLELVYGVLFEPGKTMKRVAGQPPLGLVMLIVTVLSMLGTLMGLLTFSRVLAQNLNAMPKGQLLSVAVIILLLGGILWGYVKWFVYSAVLHLAAALLGGRGEARGVFAAAGLSWIPSIFMAPVQFLGYWLWAGNTAVTVLVILAGLAVGIWSIILMVIGLKQAHDLPTGRSVFAVLSPLIAFIVVGFLTVMVIVVLALSIPTKMNLPGYF